MDLKDTLLAYGEWLDGQMQATAQDPVDSRDDRSWEQLGKDFIQEWESDPTRATLAGREPVTGAYAPGEPVLPPTRAGVVG